MQLHNFSSDVKQSTDKQHKKSESSFSEGINADQILETVSFFFFFLFFSYKIIILI